MTWWKATIAALLVLSCAAIAVAGLRERPPPPTEVQLSSARRSVITRTVTGAGKVQAATTVKISSSLSGELTELLVKEGERVAKGQVLAKLERRRYDAAARQFQAAQSAARSDMQLYQVEVNRMIADLARVEGLVQRGMSSGAELDKARSDKDAAAARWASARERHAQAAAAYEEAQTSLSKTILVSPIEGTVIEVSREVGERVRGSELSEDVMMTIAALSAMEVKIEVGEHEVVHLKPGQRADVMVDALEGQTYAGTVAEIAQKALIKNPGTESEVTTFPVTVTLDSRPPGVLPGMSAEVRISAETRENAVIVPVQAVTVRPEKVLGDGPPVVEGVTPALAASKRGELLAKVVFVVDSENRAQPRRVRTGIASDTDVEIVEGLIEGERVIEGPYRTLAKELKSGDLVKERSEKDGKNRSRS